MASNILNDPNASSSVVLETAQTDLKASAAGTIVDVEVASAILQAFQLTVGRELSKKESLAEIFTNFYSDMYRPLVRAGHMNGSYCSELKSYQKQSQETDKKIMSLEQEMKFMLTERSFDEKVSNLNQQLFDKCYELKKEKVHNATKETYYQDICDKMKNYILKQLDRIGDPDVDTQYNQFCDTFPPYDKGCDSPASRVVAYQNQKEF